MKLTQEAENSRQAALAAAREEARLKLEEEQRRLQLEAEAAVLKQQASHMNIMVNTVIPEPSSATAKIEVTTTMLPASEILKEETLPDGTRIMVQADGTTIQYSTDGCVITSYTNGTVLQRNADGVEITIYADGSRIQHNLDGSSVWTLITGMTITTHLDGSSTQYDPATGVQILTRVNECSHCLACVYRYLRPIYLIIIRLYYCSFACVYRIVSSRGSDSNAHPCCYAIRWTALSNRPTLTAW